jgi:hypothetical protein
VTAWAAAVAALLALSLWASQTDELLAAIGLSNSRRPWDRFVATHPNLTDEQRLLSAPILRETTGTERAVLLHGLALIQNEPYPCRDGHPIQSILWAQIHRQGTGLLSEVPIQLGSGPLLQLALRDAPDDPLLETSWLVWRTEESSVPPPLVAAERMRRENAGRSKRIVETDDATTGRLWPRMLEATEVLVDHSQIGLQPLQIYWWTPGGGAFMNMRGGSPAQLTAEVASGAYREALQRIAETPPESLEEPFEARLRALWERVGLAPAAAAFAARADQGHVARIIGWHTTQHARAVESLGIEAFAVHDFEAAADWAELGVKLCELWQHSVHSPYLFNSLVQRQADMQSILTSIAQADACPAELRQRVQAILAGHPVGPYRTLTPASPYLMPALYLDNVSRGLLAIATATLFVAALIWVNLRLTPPRSELANHPISPSYGWGVTILGVFLACVLLVAIEAANLVGSHAATLFYDVARILFLLMLLAGFCRLVIIEWIRDGDPLQRKTRRRMSALVCLFILLAMARLVFGRNTQSADPSSFARLSLWAFHTNEVLSFRSFAGVFLALMCVSYGILVLVRRRRDEGAPLRIHPALPIVIGVFLAIWLIIAPRLESLHLLPPAGGNGSGERSPAFVAADGLGIICQMHESILKGTWTANSQFMGGCNALTASMMVRINHVAVWMITAFGMIWGAIVWLRSRRRQAAGDLAGDDHESQAFREWLAAMMESCFWTGLAATVLYVCTAFAQLYCTNQVIGSR